MDVLVRITGIKEPGDYETIQSHLIKCVESDAAVFQKARKLYCIIRKITLSSKNERNLRSNDYTLWSHKTEHLEPFHQLPPAVRVGFKGGNGVIVAYKRQEELVIANSDKEVFDALADKYNFIRGLHTIGKTNRPNRNYYYLNRFCTKPWKGGEEMGFFGKDKAELTDFLRKCNFALLVCRASQGSTCPDIRVIANRETIAKYLDYYSLDSIAFHASWYAINILNARWKEAEELIKTNDCEWKKYIRAFPEAEEKELPVFGLASDDLKSKYNLFLTKTISGNITLAVAKHGTNTKIIQGNLLFINAETGNLTLANSINKEVPIDLDSTGKLLLTD